MQHCDSSPKCISLVFCCLYLWVFLPHFPHVVYFIRVNHPQEFMGAVLSCVSSTFPGQVFKKTLPFMLVNTSAQLAQLLKGYLANCYRKNKRQIWAPRGNGLLLLKSSAKAITICWWCSKGQAYFLFSLPVQYHFLTLALDRAVPSPPPPAQSWEWTLLSEVPKRMPLKCENLWCWCNYSAACLCRILLQVPQKRPKQFSRMALSFRGWGRKRHNWIRTGCGFVEQFKKQFKPRWRVC